MINNTSSQRWQRAASRSVDAQFVNEVIQGMACSPFEAEAIRDKVHEVYGPLMEGSENLMPGQMRVSVVDASVAANIPLAQAKQRLVSLTLDCREDRKIRQQSGIIGLRRHRLCRICEEAFSQGGLLTLEGIADLFNCAVRTLVSDVASLRKEDVYLPLRSSVKDMGRAVSHRRLILEKWLGGQEYSEIATSTHHSVASVANYVEKFQRVYVLIRTGFDLDAVGVIARLSPALVNVFAELVEQSSPVDHRRKQLECLSQKGGVPEEVCLQ